MIIARVMELLYIADLKSAVERHVGWNPTTGTIINMEIINMKVIK